MRNLLLISILLPILVMIFMGYYDGDTQWIMYDTQKLLIPIFLSLALFKSIQYRDVQLKCLSLLAVLVSMWAVVDYLLLKTYVELWIRHVNDVLFCLTAVPAALNIIYRPYNSTAQYRPDGRFNVYKRPKNLQGAIAALITTPHGSCSTVINGIEFIFKNGTRIGRTYKPRKADVYVEINEANEELGIELSLFRNCFICKGKEK